MIALVAALAGPRARADQPLDAETLARDSAALASALGAAPLELTMRGTTVSVLASAMPAEGGCAALISARAPGRTRSWTRLFRWSDAAWSGTLPDGRTMVSFYEQEGRLAGDTLVFAAGDAAAVSGALARVASGCRGARPPAERILRSSQGAASGCYFARLPSLELLGSFAPPPGTEAPRAVLTILSRENPQAELQLLLERAAPAPAAGGDDWGRPAVAFTYADPRLKDMRVAAASFALDARPVAAEHALTAYGDTRVRVTMDPFKAPVGGKGTESFYRRLAASGEATLTLLDGAGQTQAVLHFDAGPVLAIARRALKAADWSCAGASPAPEPAARWQPAG